MSRITHYRIMTDKELDGRPPERIQEVNTGWAEVDADLGLRLIYGDEWAADELGQRQARNYGPGAPKGEHFLYIELRHDVGPRTLYCVQMTPCLEWGIYPERVDLQEPEELAA